MADAVLSDYARPAAIVHTSALRDQILDRAGPNVTVHTIQGLLASGVSLAGHDVVWLDEAHHYVGSSWEGVWGLLGPATAVLGVTATPARADGKGLGARFRSLVCAANYSQLLADGYLTPCDVVRPRTTDPAQAYLQHAPYSHDRPAPGIIFTPTKRTARHAVNNLQAAGVRAAAIDADTSDRERRRVIGDYSQGRLDVLASPAALAEGFDSPRAQVCVLARPCHSESVYLQCVGRVLRPYPGKDRALLVDCAGASLRHGHPTTDRVYSLQGRGIRRPSPAPRPSRPRPTKKTNPVVAVGRGLWQGLLWACGLK